MARPSMAALRHGWTRVALAAVIGGVVAAAVALAVPRTWVAEARLVVAGPENDAALAAAAPGIQLPRPADVKTQAGLLRSRPLFAEVAKRLALRTDADGLMERVTVEPVPDSSIILVRAKAPKAQEAADVANTVAQVYITSTRDSRARNLAKASEQLRANVEAVVRELAAAEVAAKRGPLSADAVVQRTVAEDRLKGLTAALEQVTLAQQNAGDVAKLTEAAAAPKTPAGPSPLSAALAGLLAGALVGALAVSMRHAPPAEAPIAQPPLARSA